LPQAAENHTTAMDAASPNLDIYAVYSHNSHYAKENPMQKFSPVNLLRDIKTVTMAAGREPVTITLHRKPRCVLMTCDAYQAMTRDRLIETNGAADA
jgi:hypothetical protein